MRAKTTKTTIMIMGAVLMAAGCNGAIPGAAPAKATGAAPVASSGAVSAPMASLLEGRDGPACALVGTGTVLVAGGRTANADATDTAELVLASGAVVPVMAHMTTPRTRAKAVRLDDHRVLIVGGVDDNRRELASTEVYDARLDTFAKGPTLSATHDFPAVAFVGSSLLVLGGATTRDVDAIDLGTLKASKLPGGLASGHMDAHAAVSSGLVVVGGRDGNLPEVYDAVAGKVVATKDASKLSGQTIVPSGGVVLLVGGFASGEPFQPSTLELEKKGFVAIGSVGAARFRGRVVPFMGGMLVLGGDDLHAALAGTDLLLSPVNAIPGPTLITPREDLSAVALADGRVVVVGGTLVGSNVPCADVEMLVPPGGALPSPTAQLDAAIAQDQLLTQTIMELNVALANEKRLQDQVAQLDSQVAILQAQVAKEQAALTAAQLQLQTANATIAQLRSQLASASAASSGVSAQLAAAQASAAAAQAQANAANARAAALQAQLTGVTGQLNADQALLVQSQAQVAQLQAQIAQQKGQPAPPAPAPASPAPLPASTGPNVPVIRAIDPTAGVPGQTITVWMTVSVSNNVVVTFGGTPGTITQRSLGNFNGLQLDFFDVTVPAVSPGSYPVQVTGDGMTSQPVHFTVQ